MLLFPGKASSSKYTDSYATSSDEICIVKEKVNGQTKTKKHLLYVVNHKHEQSIYLYYSSPRDVSFYTLSLFCLVELQLICNALSSISHWFTLLTAIYAMDPGPDVGVYCSFLRLLKINNIQVQKPRMGLCLLIGLAKYL